MTTYTEARYRSMQGPYGIQCLTCGRMTSRLEQLIANTLQGLDYTACHKLYTQKRSGARDKRMQHSRIALSSAMDLQSSPRTLLVQGPLTSETCILHDRTPFAVFLMQQYSSHSLLSQKEGHELVRIMHYPVLLPHARNTTSAKVISSLIIHGVS